MSMPDEVYAPLHVEDVPIEPQGDAEPFVTLTRRLTPSRLARHIGVVYEELPPGKRSCPFHYHMAEEEHIYVLEGEGTLRLGDVRYPLRAGHYAVFPAGQRVGHQLLNEGTLPLRYLVIGERNPHDVCVYPDSDKVYIRSTQGIHRMSATLDYFDGELPGAPA